MTTPFSSFNVAVGDYVVPTTPNGRLYRVETGDNGTSGGSEPTFGTTDGGTTADNTVTWTEQSLQIELGTWPEVANAGAYARQTNNPLDANWTDGANGLTDNAANIEYPQASANWGQVVGFMIADSATYGAGNDLVWGILDAYKTINTNDIFRFNTGDLNVTVD